MKNKIAKIFIFALVAIMLFGAVSSLAYQPYETYTFSIKGNIVSSPMAYHPFDSLEYNQLGIMSDSDCVDIVCDELGCVYISDKKYDTVHVYDENYIHTGTIESWVDEYGEEQRFNQPSGIFITSADEYGERYIYVCDYLNKRVVVFDYEHNYVRSYYRPESKILDENAFAPRAIAVDQYGRMFIVSPTCGEGIIVLTKSGQFSAFIGAQQTKATSISSIIGSLLGTNSASGNILSAPYNNITIDEGGFIYATINLAGAAGGISGQYEALTSKQPQYSPIKKMNSVGDNILRRNGFFDPGGEASIKAAGEVSTIIDVSLGAEGAWTILDSRRARLYTYNQNGDLMYAFGDTGSQLGNCENPVGFTYQKILMDGVERTEGVDANGNKLLLLIRDDDGNVVNYLNEAQELLAPDKSTVVAEGVDEIDYYEFRILMLDKTVKAGFAVNIYTPTTYADSIRHAMKMENKYLYDQAEAEWQSILTENNNFDLAYIGLGKALFAQERYSEAMEMFKASYETAQYSLAYTELRNDVMQRPYVLIPLVIAVVLLVYLLIKLLGKAKKKNKAVSLKVGKKTYVEELVYACHVIFHPFDGFWDLKHEKRGSVRAATTFLGLTVIAFFYYTIGQGYIFQPRQSEASIFTALLSVGIPVLLLVLANWCLTTLFEGEGSLKDIYIATCYSLVPLPPFLILATILSNFMTESEKITVTMLIILALVWTIFLLFFALAVTHDYTMGKNFLTILATILAAAVIMFIIVLFFGLLTKMTTFVQTIFTEVGDRVS